MKSIETKAFKLSNAFKVCERLSICFHYKVLCLTLRCFNTQYIPAFYNEFGYYEYSTKTSKLFLCDINVKTVHYLQRTDVCECYYIFLYSWPPRGQQVSHQRWIGGFRCTRGTKYTSQGIPPFILKFVGDVTRTGLSVAPQKRLTSPKN